MFTEFCHLAMCGWLPPCQDGCGGLPPLIIICFQLVCSQVCCATRFHISSLSSFCRDQTCSESIVISHSKKSPRRQLQWNAIAICATFRICCLIGELLTRADSANISQDSLNHVEQKLDVIPKLRKTKAMLYQFGKKVSLGIFVG